VFWNRSGSEFTALPLGFTVKNRRFRSLTKQWRMCVFSNQKPGLRTHVKNILPLTCYVAMPGMVACPAVSGDALSTYIK
jgi:hypothetical protein